MSASFILDTILAALTLALACYASWMWPSLRPPSAAA